MDSAVLLARLASARLLELSPMVKRSEIRNIREQLEFLMANGALHPTENDLERHRLVLMQWALELSLFGMADSGSFIHVTLTDKIPTPMCVETGTNDPTVMLRRHSIPIMIRARQLFGQTTTSFFACHMRGERMPHERERFEQLKRVSRQALHEIPMVGELEHDGFSVSGAFWLALHGGALLGCAIGAPQWRRGGQQDVSPLSLWAGEVLPGSPITDRLLQLGSYLNNNLPATSAAGFLKQKLSVLLPEMFE